VSVLWIVAAALGLVLFLRVFHLHNNQAIRRDWEMLLTPAGLQAYRQLKASISLDLETAGYSYGEALRFRDAGSVDDAIRLLRSGCAVIAQAAPDRLRLLAGMSVYSRMVAAMLPVRPLPVRGFRLPGTWGVAGLATVLHHVVVTSVEQFRIRLWALREGFRIVPRVVARSTDRVAAHRTLAGTDWERVMAGQADFQLLSDESLESFRILVTALCAEKRELVLSSPVV
jgi:hypothetical protein